MEEVKKVNANEIMDIVKANGGKIFAMTFIKSDGTLRKAVGRLGVHNVVEIKGTGMTGAEKYKAYNLIQYWDMEKNGYRCAKADKVQTLTIAGTKYEVENTDTIA